MSQEMTYRQALLQAMTEAFKENDNVICMGQGISDPTAIFGTTTGLLETYGEDRVIDTPIAEEGMTGIALGASATGLYPIITHIRADFLMVAMNQIVNLVAKYKYMYGGMFQAPMLIRTIIGRSWGQGPQHSQSLHSLFGHIPGLRVIMPSSAQDVIASYRHAINEVNGPVISFEHRLLYDFTFSMNEPKRDPFTARIVKEGKDITILATSYMVQEAQKAAAWVMEKEHIQCEVIDLHNISHIDFEQIFKSLEKTRRLLIADAGWQNYGVAAEVARGILTTKPDLLKNPMSSLGMAQTPCPTSHALEDAFYPEMNNLVSEIYKQVLGEDHQKEIPTLEYAKAQKKQFKGPF